jgi:hypothetical protein
MDRKLNVRFEVSQRWLWRIPSSGMWRRVDLVWTTFRRNVSPPSSGTGGCRLSAATCSRWFLARGFFYLEDGGDTFLRNVGSHKIYMAPHLRRRHYSEEWMFKDIIGLYKVDIYTLHISKCILRKSVPRPSRPTGQSNVLYLKTIIKMRGCAVFRARVQIKTFLKPDTASIKRTHVTETKNTALAISSCDCIYWSSLRTSVSLDV